MKAEGNGPSVKCLNRLIGSMIVSGVRSRHEAEALGIDEALSLLDEAPAAATQPPEAPLDLTDEAALAELLNSNGYHLETAFVRHFKGKTATTSEDLVVAVCHDRNAYREWATIKTWTNRVKNALHDVSPACRLEFSVSRREGIITKRVLPE